MNEQRRARRERRGVAGRLVLGVYLVGLGALMLAERLGYEIPGEIKSYWPFLVIGLGLVKLLWPGDRDERRGALWILVGGLYCWIGAWNLFGLGWKTAWPIFLVAGGLAMLFGSASVRAARVTGDGAPDGSVRRAE